MHYLKLLPFLLFVLISKPAFAGQVEFDDCMLKYLKNAKLDIATDAIKQACQENYKNPTFTAEKKRVYNDCLLEHLVGVESLHAVMEIKSACGRKYK